MAGISVRQVAVAGLVSLAAGVGLYLVPYIVGGGGLASRYIPTSVALYLLVASVGAIAIGAGLAIVHRGGGLVLMLLASLFETGVLIGSQLMLWMITSRP